MPDRALGLPVLRALSLCTCCRQYPGAATGRRLRSSHPAVSAFPEVAVGSACTSTFSELARRSLELRPAHSRRHLYVTSYTEGFSHFVTSMTAPVASGWSVRRVGLAPTGKRRLLTAHANSGRSPTAWRTGQIGPFADTRDWAEEISHRGDRGCKPSGFAMSHDARRQARCWRCVTPGGEPRRSELSPPVQRQARVGH